MYPLQPHLAELLSEEDIKAHIFMQGNVACLDPSYYNRLIVSIIKNFISGCYSDPANADLVLISINIAGNVRKIFINKKFRKKAYIEIDKFDVEIKSAQKDSESSLAEYVQVRSRNLIAKLDDLKVEYESEYKRSLWEVFRGLF